MYWFLKCLKQYFDFATRARRMEYWNFVIILWIILGIVCLIFHSSVRITPSDLIHFNITADLISDIGIVPFLVSCFFVIPYFAVTVRRLHDINRSALWLLIMLIPFFGGIWMFFLMITDGFYYDNRWGRNPKLHLV